MAMIARSTCTLRFRPEGSSPSDSRSLVFLLRSTSRRGSVQSTSCNAICEGVTISSSSSKSSATRRSEWITGTAICNQRSKRNTYPSHTVLILWNRVTKHREEVTQSLFERFILRCNRIEVGLNQDFQDFILRNDTSKHQFCKGFRSRGSNLWFVFRFDCLCPH